MRRILAVSVAFQLIFTTNAFTQFPRNYRAYYDSINLAELRTVELDFQNAYTTYKKAFSDYEKRHLNDLHNATLCAILVGNYAQAKEWIMELITMGEDISTFNSYIFKKLPDNFWVEIRQNSNLLRSVYLSRIDSSYFKAIETLRTREQDFLINRKGQSSYDSLIFEHAKVLHALIKEKGISPVPIFGKFPLPLDVLLHHFGLRNRLIYAQQGEIDLTSEPYKSMKFELYDLEPLLTQAVFNGDISPSFLASAMAHSELDPARQLGGFTLIADLETKTITFETAKEEILEGIDRYRQSIGLETVRDAAKKDMDIRYYFTMEAFPFEEHIRRYNEIGYTKKKCNSLEPGSKELSEIYRAATRVTYDIRDFFYKNSRYIPVNNFRDEQQIFFENKSDLLKEFRFNRGIVDKMIKLKDE